MRLPGNLPTSSVMKKVSDSKRWREYVDKNNMFFRFMPGDEYEKFLREQDAFYTTIYKMLGVLK